jgi:hypothetical protein
MSSSNDKTEMTSSAVSNLALSIRQPWAELVLRAQKSIEVRSWTVDYRGPVWLHTGQKNDSEAEAHFGLRDLFHGGFIGRIEVSSVLRLDPERWERWRDRHLVPGEMPAGSFGWLLRQPVRLRKPVAAQGKLGLFEISAETLALLHLAMPAMQA